MNPVGRAGLSVVVAATDSAAAVDRLLASLRGQEGGPVEVIVVGEARVFRACRVRAPSVAPRPPLPGPLPRGERGKFSRRALSHTVEGFCPPLPSWERAGERGPGDPVVPPTPPRIRRIVAPPGSGVPRLRRLGLEAASGRVVAFTEDSCVAAPGWLGAWSSAFEDPSVVAASGAVEHDAGASAVDWAVVFCEYAPFLPPADPGPPARLAGNNFAVDREAALRLSGGEVHETALLAAILREGGGVRTVAGAVVRHVRRFGWREAFGDRFRFGLEFGRLRAGGLPPIGRLAGWVAGPAIFGVQAGRLGLVVLGGRGHLGPFFRFLPITLAMLAAWSLGEWAGWCLGPVARRPPDRPRARRRRGTAARPPGPRPGPAGSPRPGCTPGPPDA